MTLSATIRQFYRQATHYTQTVQHLAAIAALPDDVAGLVQAVQGWAIYDVVAERFYGHTLSAAQHEDIHQRSAAAQLDRLLSMNPAPLDQARPYPERIACRCRNYTILLVALLRQKGYVARARVGFARYFQPDFYEDHWVAEYWQADEARWVLVDAQLDAVWREKLGIGFDVLDLPRQQFLTAAEAWRVCRHGDADPDRFGISFMDLHGLWFILPNLLRDLAALNHREMLPYDVWGAMPALKATLSDAQLALGDELAALLMDPDANFAALRQRYASDERVRVGQTVFNLIHQANEAV